MREYTIFLLLLCLLAAQSCRQKDVLQEKGLKSYITLSATGICSKSATDTGTLMENSISKIAFFIFSGDDKLYLKEDFSSPQPLRTTLPPGTYRYRICTGDIPENVTSLKDYCSYGQSFICNGYDGGFCMAGEGEFSLGYNDDRIISTALHRNYCRIKVKNVRTSAQQFGQYPDLTALAIQRIFLMDVREKVLPDGKICDGGNVFNVWKDGKMEYAPSGIGKCTVKEFTTAPLLDIDCGKDIDTDFYCPPSASTSLVIQANGIMGNGDGATWFYRIPLECISGTSYEYSICICGPGAPTPVDPMPEITALSFNILKWDKNSECGYEEKDYSMFVPSYSLELSNFTGGKGFLTFDRIFGKASVQCSDNRILKVNGCGKNWELFAVGKGFAVLEICDGMSSTKEFINIK